MALKILLADDSMTAQNMGKKILMEAGYEVIAVSNGAAAVKKIAEQKPDVVVLDVYMPGYTGLEVCERVKSAVETTKTPVLLTVGKMEPFKPEEGARVKADGVIVKPFEASDLLAAVQKLEQRLGSKNSTQARVMSTPAVSVDETPEYERTLKIKTPIFDEADASYQSWKTETAEHVRSEPVHEEPARPEPSVHRPQGPQLAVHTPTEPTDIVGAYVESTHVEPAQVPPVRTEKIEVPAVSDEELTSVEPQALHVPTEMQAAPALGLEHLDSETPSRTAQAFEHTTEVIERSTNEINPYKIVEEASEENRTPKSSVGRFFAKAKSVFGGAAVEEDEAGAPKPAEHQFDYGDERTSPVSPQPEVTPSEPPAAPPSHETFVLGSTSAPSIQVEQHPGPGELQRSKEAAAGAVSDMHLSTVESWESILPAPPRLSSARETSGPAEPELEPSPSASTAEAPITSGMAPGLEVTSQPSGGDVPAGAGRDSMLVTDVSEMSKEFPTRFGVKDAEPVPVGNAGDYPELYGSPAGAAEPASIEDTQEIDTPAELREEPAPADEGHDIEAQVAAAMGSSWSQPEAQAPAAHEAQEPSFAASGWSAEETHLEEHERGVSLHEEMQQQLSGSQPAEERGTVVPADVGQGSPPSDADAQLAAAMAAAMGTEVTPAITEAVHQAFTGDSTIALDKNTAVIAEIVHRVTERMKPELVAEIARELALEIKKEKK